MKLVNRNFQSLAPWCVSMVVTAPVNLPNSAA